MIPCMIFFVFGTHPALSLAEIAAVLGSDLDYTRASEQILMIERPDMPLDRLQERLAGVVKIGHVVGELKGLDMSAIADLLAASVSLEQEGKISFGISIYDGGNRALEQKLKKQLSQKKRKQNQLHQQSLLKSQKQKLLNQK